MSGTVVRALLMTAVAAAVHVGLWPRGEARADSWRTPSPFETHSENGAFIARVVPADGKRKALLTVFAVVAGKTNEVWRTDLSNPTCPYKVRVSNDGSAVVTLDNWAAIGYGKDVVGIYCRHGQIAAYSLEQIAPLGNTAAGPSAKSFVPGSPTKLRNNGSYKDKFLHSISSRYWREKSIDFFFGTDGPLRFCLWLDWEKRWVAWRLNDGQLIEITEADAEALHAEANKRGWHKSPPGPGQK